MNFIKVYNSGEIHAYGYWVQWAPQPGLTCMTSHDSVVLKIKLKSENKAFGMSTKNISKSKSSFGKILYKTKTIIKFWYQNNTITWVGWVMKHNQSTQ